MTLDRDNLLWLRGRAAGRKRKSLSDALDEIVSAARLKGLPSEAPRSVVGTVDIAADDPDLARADEHLRALFSASLSRPALVRETAAGLGRGRKRKKARRG